VPAFITHFFKKPATIWITATLSIAGYILARVWFPLPPFAGRSPLSDIRTFTPSLLSGLGYGVWLLGLYALYLLAYRLVRGSKKSPGIVHILLAALVMGLPLVHSYPINANDVFRYVIRGRITSFYGGDPFTLAPNDFPQDPFLPLAGEWASATSPYGPIWEIAAAAVTTLSQADLLLGLTLFKLLGLLLHLLVACEIWWFSAGQDIAGRTARTLLWAWNPALLLMFVVDGHNDVLMIFWLLLGFLFVRRGRFVPGFLFMLLAGLTKPIGVLPLPFILLHIWRHLPDWQARARFAVTSALASGGITLLSFLPFGSPLSLAQRLLQEASSGGGFSPQVLFILAARELGWVVSVKQVNDIVFVVFAMAAAWLVWLGWRGRNPVRGASDIFLAYVWQALNFRIWYTVWPFPWLLLDEGRDRMRAFRLRAGLWFLLTAQLSVLIYGHVRVYLLGGNHLLAHIIGVPFTFIAPFAFAALKGRQGDKNQETQVI